MKQYMHCIINDFVLINWKCKIYRICYYSVVIVVQIGHDVGGNFKIHIWAYSGDFIARDRLTGSFVLM